MEWPKVVRVPSVRAECFWGLSGRASSGWGTQWIGRHTDRTRIGREALRQGLKWSVIPLAGPEVVSRPTQRAGSSREDLWQGQKWSGGPPAGLEVVGDPSGKAGSGREALRQGRK